MDNKKKTIILTLLIITALLVALVCYLKKDKKILKNPNLLSGQYRVEFPTQADTRFQEAVKGKEWEKVFKSDAINTRYTKMPWTGRVRDRGVSHQALFSVGKARVVYHFNRLEEKGLNFSVFNPQGSSLSYRISIEDNKRKKVLFNKFFEGLNFHNDRVDFNPVFKEGVRLVFETRGEGVGAWINPRFTRVKKNPRVYVMLVLDTMRLDHTSLYGYERHTTPELEKLARQGMVYLNAYSTSSWTLPAHVSLFSGKDPLGHRVSEPEDRIPGDYSLLAEIFQNQGFVTAAFTGGGFVDGQYGFHRGFQVYSNLPGRVFHLNSAEMVLNHFKNYAQRFWGEDLFVFLHTYQVHAPYKCPPGLVRHFNKDLGVNLKGPGNFIRDKKTGIFKDIGEENRKTLVDLYDTSIYYTDKSLIGGMVRFLKDKGVYESSMITVLSDHGEEFYDHGSWEHGHTLYNELVRIPLVMKYPDNQKTGKENALASITDIAGLILDAGGFHKEALDFPVNLDDPKRVLPLLFPKSPTIINIPPKISFVDREHHFIYNMMDPAKIASFDPQPTSLEVFELYRHSDVAETQNLAKKEAGVMKRFRELLKKYRELLKKLEGQKGKIDKALEKELKSLGYLNN